MTIETEYDEFINQDSKTQSDNKTRLPEVVLPHTGKLISNCAKQISTILKDKEVDIFYKPIESEIVEISEIKEGKDDNEITIFKNISPARAINIIEGNLITGVYVENKEYDPSKHSPDKKYIFKPKSLTSEQTKIIMLNDCFKLDLRNIQRLFTTQLPFIYDGKLTFQSLGHDSRFNSWTPHNAPKINPDLTMKEGKEIMKMLYGEFCFKDEQSLINAISHLLTNFCIGIFPSFNTRTPIFFWEANRERAGKDFGANIPSIVFDGAAIENSPISTTGKDKNGTEELRKKITSFLKQGRRRFHSSNNRGHLNNEVLEMLATAAYWEDRILGSNNTIRFPNEIMLSLSGNVGYTASPDFINRCKFVRLHLEIEDANKREFKNPNLHKWILENRGYILSGLYSFVREWFKAGKPKGKTPFTSFPVWAEIIGGIMTHCQLGDPCKADDNSLIAADRETTDMKIFFETAYKNFPDEFKLKKDWIDFLVNNEDCKDIFNYYDFEKTGDRSRFALMFQKYVKRIFSDISLQCDGNPVASRQKFKFTKEKIVNQVKIGLFEDLDNEKSVRVVRDVRVCPDAVNKSETKNPIIIESRKIPYNPINPYNFNNEIYDYIKSNPNQKITFWALKGLFDIEDSELKDILESHIEKGDLYKDKNNRETIYKAT